jgi:hypothetical protein
MFVPGENRESAEGASCDGAGRFPGVAVGVAVGVGVGVGVGVAPLVTVIAAVVVVSRNAVIVAEVVVLTANVVTEKVADVCPAGTVTTPGAVATPGLLVASVTVMPPEGEGALKDTVPVALVPPVTLVGLMESDCNRGVAFGSG